MNTLVHQHVIVLGLGTSGLAMARWCVKQGAVVRVADSRAMPPGLAALRQMCPQVEVVLGAIDASILDGADLVVVSPGLDPRQGVIAEARRRGIPVIGEIALFVDALSALGEREQTRILAITGTNGKTTVTALAAALACSAGLDAVVAGNISPSALDVLMERLDQGRALPQCWVLELSSFQLETMAALNADAATVLNITEDHLDRYTDISEYASVKSRIFAGTGVQVLCRDDDRVMAMAQAGRQQVCFGAGLPDGEEAFGLMQQDTLQLMQGTQALVPLSSLALAGIHNALNVQAALALCSKGLGLPVARFLDGLKTFRGLPHRVEWVAERTDGVRYYDDSKGTNVGATLAALEGLGRQVVLIAGGDGKGQDFSSLMMALKRYARALILIGRDAQRIEKAVQDSGVPIVHALSLEEAVTEANALAEAGDAVLLSPACASMDMFRDYIQRAEVFMAAVRVLPGVRRR